VAGKVTKKVWFERCNCGAESGPHGYFFTQNEGRCPWPTMSNEAAEVMLPGLGQDYDLTADEVVALREEVEAAELPERMGNKEKAMLLEYAVHLEATQAEATETEMSADLTLALVLATAEIEDDEDAQAAALIIFSLLSA